MSATVKINFKNVYGSGFLLVFSALLAAALVDQSLNKQIEGVIQSRDGLSNMIFLWGGLSLVSSLLFPMIISFLCCHTLAGIPLGRREFIKSKFELGLLEMLRAWGKTFLWTFAFVLPGFVAYTYYFLTPFVVIFSRDYADGKVDALKYSAKLTSLFFWRLNLWLTVFYMGAPILLSTLLDEKRVFRLSPFTATLSVLLETLLVFIFHYLILKLFIHYLNKVEAPDVTAI